MRWLTRRLPDEIPIISGKTVSSIKCLGRLKGDMLKFSETLDKVTDQMRTLSEV